MSFSLPWFPFFLNDWDTDEAVRSLSLRGKAIYVALFCIQWREGSVPLNPIFVERLVASPRDRAFDDMCDNHSELPSLRADIKEVLQFFPPVADSRGGRGKRGAHPKLAVIRQEALIAREKQVVFGKLGRQKQLASGLPQASPRDPPGEPRASQSQSHINTTTARSAKSELPKARPYQWQSVEEMERNAGILP